MSIATFPGIKSGKQETISLDLKLTSNTEEIVNYMISYKSNKKKKPYQDEMTFVKYLLPTTMGKIIQCTY